VSLRAQLEAFPPDAQLLVFTTLGHVYVGAITDIEDEAVRLTRPDGSGTIVISLGDVSGVRPVVEEPEEHELPGGGTTP
jgi:hypothetical protein